MTDQEKWHAVARSDGRYDGVFFYAVQSTGVFCRPSCRSKTPRPENAVFFATATEAGHAGFRPCKRCRPDLLAYQPAQEIAEQAKAALDGGYSDARALAAALDGLGVTRRRLDAIFKARYGMTVNEYLRGLRLDEARALLARTDTGIAEIAYGVGFESLSSFYRFFRKQAGASPAQYRKAHAEKGNP